MFSRFIFMPIIDFIFTNMKVSDHFNTIVFKMIKFDNSNMTCYYMIQIRLNLITTLLIDFFMQFILSVVFNIFPQNWLVF
jgi:hypothetical protein